MAVRIEDVYSNRTHIHLSILNSHATCFFAGRDVHRDMIVSVCANRAASSPHFAPTMRGACPDSLGMCVWEPRCCKGYLSMVKTRRSAAGHPIYNPTRPV